MYYDYDAIYYFYYYYYSYAIAKVTNIRTFVISLAMPFFVSALSRDDPQG